MNFQTVTGNEIDFQGGKVSIPGARIVASTTPARVSSGIRLDQEYNTFCRQFSPQAGWTEKSEYVPAVLTPNAAIKNVADCYKVVDKFGDLVNSRMGEAVEEIMLGMLQQSGCEFDFVSHEEAIHGRPSSPGKPAIEAIPMDTSCGLLLAQIVPKGRRRVKASLHDMGTWIHELLREDYRALKDNLPYIWIYAKTLKDELRDVERVALEKTRVFDGGPYSQTYTQRRLEADFYAKMYDAAKRLNFFSAAGMDWSRGKWHEFMRRLTRDFDPKWCERLKDLDIEKWDKYFSNLFHYLNARILYALCLNKNRHLIMRNAQRMTLSLHLLRSHGILYQANRNQQSGRVDTLVGNSLTNLRVIVYAFCMTYNSSSWTLECFRSVFEVRYMGDDFLGGFSPFCRVTPSFLQQVYKIFGWNTTSNQETEYANITQVLFAGRTSVWIAGCRQYWPVLPRERLKAINEWIKHGSAWEQNLERYRASCILAFPLFMVNGDELFCLFYEWFMDRTKEAVARGLRVASLMLSDMYALYSGQLIPEVVLLERYKKTYSVILEEKRKHNVICFSQNQRASGLSEAHQSA